MHISSRNRGKEPLDSSTNVMSADKEAEVTDEFMAAQYERNNQAIDNGKPKVGVRSKSSHSQNSGTETEELAFVGAQYDNAPSLPGQSKQVTPLPHTVPPPSTHSKAEVAPKLSPSPQKTTKQESPDYTTRKETKKKQQMDEFLRLQAEKKNKEQEEYNKHKAFLADVEARRRANALLIKAKRKRNEIFAAQKNGLRKRLVAEWPLLNEEQKISTRSLRARRNIKCEKCGTLGYFTEICPNNCFNSKEDEESSLTELEQMLKKPQRSDYDEDYEEKAQEGQGFLWGPNTTYAHEAMAPEREKIHRGNLKANLNPLKVNMRREKDTLRGLDEGIPSYAYNSAAEDGYHRDLSEVTLHKILRYVMRTMQKEITKNAEKLEADKDFDLFHPPMEKPGANFYPKEIWDIKEHRGYLTKQALQQERRINQAHSHHGSTRPDDAMGAYYRGGSSADLNSLYHPDKKAGQSMHSKIGWKGILSTNDDLAIADPNMQAKMDAMEKLLEKQKAWTRVQKKAFENTNERYQHMWNIVKEEVNREHDREYRLLSVDVHSNLYETQRNVWMERLEASDRIIDTLLKYQYINGSSEADYALQSLQSWRAELKESLGRKGREAPGQGGVGGARRAKPKKKKIKAKQMFAKMGMNQRTEEVEGQDDGDDSVSLASLASSLDSETRGKLAELGASLATENKGGYKGLGFASEFEVAKEVDSYDCNAAISAALLAGGASSLFEENKIASPFMKTKKKSPTKDGSERALFKQLNLKYKLPQAELDRKNMADKEKKYAAVGMERNIRQGSNEDSSQCTPSLIPIHEVFSATRDDHIQSTAAQQIVLKARLSRTNAITGHIGKEYVHMYVRNTLFEKNGTSEGGDQTYENMGKDSRYSGQLGRTMQALEPSKNDQKNLKKKFMRSTRQGLRTGSGKHAGSHDAVERQQSLPSVAKKGAKIRF